MSDNKTEAMQTYKLMLCHQEENDGNNEIETEIGNQEERQKVQTLVLAFLCLCRVDEKFHYQEFPKVIVASCEMDKFDPRKAAMAFLNVESYIILLCLKPWKQEFHKLKVILHHYNYYSYL